MRIIIASMFLFSQMMFAEQTIKLRVVDEFTCSKASNIVLVEDLLDSDGNLLVAKGTKVAYGLDWSEKGPIGKEGYIKAIFGYVRDSSGRAIMFKGKLEVRGENRAGLSIGLAVGLFFVIGPFSPFLLFIPGENTSIPKGFEFEVTLDRENEQLFSSSDERKFLVQAIEEAS